MKTYKVVFTPRAERKLAALYDYIATAASRERADSFVGELVADCLALAIFPERGTKRDGIRPNLRTKGFRRRATIAFSVEGEVDVDAALVAIHGVFYGGQDFEAVLKDVEGDD